MVCVIICFFSSQYCDMMQVAKATPSDVTPVPSSQQENREAQEIPKPGDPMGHFSKQFALFFYSNQNYVKTRVGVLDQLGLAT